MDNFTTDQNIDKRYISKTRNESFDILFNDSDISFLYSLNAPFQITYEYYSGRGEQDYLNVITLSEMGVSYSQEIEGLHNYTFKNKASHFHNYYEFLIVLDGTITQHIEGKDYLYSAGSCCLINRNLSHKENFDSAARILFLGFSTEYIQSLFEGHFAPYFKEEELIRETTIYEFIRNDLKNPGQKAYLDFIPTLHNHQNLARLHDLCEKLMQAIMFPRFGSTFLVNGLLCSILTELATPENYHHTCVEVSNSSDYLLFARIEHLLVENDGRVSRAELAQKLNYSGDYLNRIVNKYTNMSLHEYGMTFCLKKAAHILRHTTLPIAEIASGLGFSNRTHFYKLFKDKYGVTPREYREKN